MIAITEQLAENTTSQLVQQAQSIEDPKLRAAAEKTAARLAAQERSETVSAARSAPFARVPLWAFYLPITRRQMLVLGRVFSFQCSTNKDGTPGEYRMSLANGASELRMANRAEMQKAMQPLMQLGFIVKCSNGTRKPATYRVDEVACMAAARRNGYQG